jgi:hypothetical protein
MRNAPGFSVPEKNYIGGKRVRGPGGVDRVPAALTKDEFVIKAPSARKIGYGALNHMNRTGEIPMRMAIAKSKPKMQGAPGRMKLQMGGISNRQRQLDAQEEEIVKGTSPTPPTPTVTPASTKPFAFSPTDDALDTSIKREARRGVVPGMATSIGRRFFASGGRTGLRGSYAGGGGAHPGFKAVQAKIAAKSGVPMKNAGAILAASTRRASPAAKRANPRLNRVK